MERKTTPVHRLLAPILILLLTPALFASSWQRIPTDQLLDESDLVVIGRIVSEHPAPPETSELGHELYYTFGTIEIEEVLYGRPAGESVVLKYGSFPETGAGLSYSAGARGIWILRQIEGSNLYSADYPWRFEPIVNRPIVERGLTLMRTRQYGPPEKGLSLYFQATKEPYPLADVELSLGLRNVGEAPVSVSQGSGHLEIELIDPRGRSRTCPPWFHSKFQPDIETVSLKPGQVLRDFETLEANLTVPPEYVGEPGAYRARLTYTETGRNNSWRGRLISQWVAFKVADIPSGKPLSLGESTTRVSWVDNPYPSPPKPGSQFQYELGASPVLDLAFSSDAAVLAAQSAQVVNAWELPGGTDAGSAWSTYKTRALLGFAVDHNTVVQADGKPSKLTRPRGDRVRKQARADGLAIDRAGLMVIAEDDRKLSLVDLTRDVEVANVSLAASPRQGDPDTLAAVSSKGGRLWAVSEGAPLTCWTVQKGIKQAEFSMHRKVTSMAVSPADGRAVIADDQGHFVTYQVGQLGPKFVPTHLDAVKKIEFSGDGDVMIAGDGRSVGIFDGTNLQLLKIFDNYQACALSPNGDLLAVARGAVVDVFQVADGRKSHQLSVLQIPTAAAFSSENRLLAIAGQGSCDFWDLEAGRPRRVTLESVGKISRVRIAETEAVTIDDSGVATIIGALREKPAVKETVVGRRRDARHHSSEGWVWLDGEQGKDGILPMLHPSGGAHIEATETSLNLRDRNHRNLWSVTMTSGPSQGTVYSVPAQPDPRGAAFSEDGSHFAYLTQDGYVQVADLSTETSGRVGRVSIPPFWARDSADQPMVNGLAVGPKGQTMVTTDLFRALIWDVKRQAVVSDIALGYAAITDLALSSHGRILALLHEREGKVTLWKMPRGEFLGVLITLGGPEVEWAVMAPDGRYDGTPAALSTVLWRGSDGAKPLTDTGLYKPGLLTEILSEATATADLRQK